MAVTMEALAAILGDVQERVKSLPVALTEDQVKAIAETAIKQAMEDPAGDAPYRKMRFGQSPASLVGSKFARWNLGVADVEFLFDLQESLKGQKRPTETGVYEGPSEELRNAFKAISDAYYLPQEEVKRIDQKALDNLFPRIPLASLSPADAVIAGKGQWWLTEAYQSALKAMDSAESGYGSQLIGAQYVGELWDAARKDSRIFGLIESFEMQAPTVYLPVEVDFPELLYVAESTANNSSNYTTVKTGSNRVSVTAKKFVLHQMWSGELDEDSIIPFIPFLRRQAAMSIAYHSDSLVLNGDDTNAATGNINLDDADPADTKHYLAFDGVRHAALIDNTGNAKDLAGPITWNELSKQRGRMVDATYKVDWGHPADPNDLVYTSDLDTADRISELDEVKTVDKYGPNATILTGEVARIGRHPLIPSIAMSKTEADGKLSTTGSNNVKGQVAAFNRRGFKVGWRRRVKLETERIPATDQTRLVYSMRLGFGRFTPTGSASGIEAADVIYDIDVT